MPAIEILDANDPRIEEFSQIRERDLMRSRGQFIAEGKVVLQHLLSASSKTPKFQIKKLLILKNRMPGLTDPLAQVPDGIPVFTAEREIIDQIAGFPMHRGILAVGSYQEDENGLDWLEKPREPSLVLIASQIANHDNMGSIFRNAAALGVHHVMLDGQCCNPLYRKAIRVSVGAALTVPYSTTADLRSGLSALREHGYQLFGLTPNEGQSLRDAQFPSKTAIILGAEGEGLDSVTLSQIHKLRINQSSDIDSLNVSVASGIALWHIAEQMNLL